MDKNADSDNDQLGPALTNGAVRALDPVPVEEVRAQLETVLASRIFRSAPGQRHFLKYTVDETLAGRSHLLKEYSIGLEAFGRGDGFDPRLDPIVRTQANKLRAKLAKYYETEGLSDPLRIELPKGSYVPAISRVVGEAPDAAILPPEFAPTTSTPAYTAGPLTEAEPPQTQPETDQPSPLPVVSSPSWKTELFTQRPAIWVAICAGLAGLFYIGYLAWNGGRPTAADTSVAVLPFVNLSENHEEDFLSDGITEELIDSLRETGSVQVVGRTSAFRYKSKTVSEKEIGSQLHVGTVLVGSVRKTDNHLRITAQLNSVESGRRLWSGSYERNLDDARVVAWEISRSVSSVVGASGEGRGMNAESRGAAITASPNPESYRDYLKGLYFWNKVTADGLRTAIQYFEQSIAEDPSYARAYTALADSYVNLHLVTNTPIPEMSEKIKAAAKRALEIDPKLGDAHIDLAISAEYDFDWPGAEREFREGLRLSPNNAVGHLWYGRYLAYLSPTDQAMEALKQRRIAAELDPVSPYAVNSVGMCLLRLGRFPEAIQQFQGALALDPSFGSSHEGLGLAYIRTGQPGKAIEEMQLANKSSAGARRESYLAYVYALAGKPDQANPILARFLAERRSGKPFPALPIARIYLGLGDRDRTIEWLDKAVDERDLDLGLRWDPQYDPIRSDERFKKLLRRMKYTIE